MYNVESIMAKKPMCCTPEMALTEIAQLMLKYDCGEIPVVYSLSDKKVLGVITYKDIVLRSIAIGHNPMAMTAKECMTYPPIMVKTTTSIEDCCQIMEDNHLRRLPVVDEFENCCGVISLADIAKSGSTYLAVNVEKHLAEKDIY